MALVSEDRPPVGLPLTPPRHPGSPGSPALAALLSGLLPGLGQLYQDRWVRGLLMLLIPIFGLSLVIAFAFLADPLTALLVRNAALAALLVVGGLFAYHVTVVADAFAGRLGAAGGLRGRHVIDYTVLLGVTILLAAFYGGVYKQSAAWADVLSVMFEPVGRTISIGIGTFSIGSGPAEPTPIGWSGRDRLNVLLLGIDTREGDGSTRNTDTMIVVSLDPLNKTGAMLSIPRDTLVDIPGFGRDKVNAAYAYGGERRGPDIARRTVEGLLGIPVHSYALVDFEAFRQIVDSVGGVVVDIPRPLRDESFPTEDFGVQRVRFLAGPQLLDGDSALIYARSRHDSNDFSRARRQQAVLGALRVRLAQGGLFRIPGLLDRVGPAVRTNFDPGSVIPLARTGTDIDASQIRSEVLEPCAGGAVRCELTEQNGDDGYYLIPDRAKVRDLVAELFYDPRVKLEAAKIEVRGAGVRADVAEQVAQKLEARAFNVARVTEDGQRGRSQVVLHQRSKRYTAEQLARQLGGVEVVVAARESTDADITLRLGTDFRGLSSGEAQPTSP